MIYSEPISLPQLPVAALQQLKSNAWHFTQSPLVRSIALIK
jgi:hypothetical protein